MSRLSTLDGRLDLCARFVRRGAKLADIGTDHAYLPVKLCLEGVCPSAVAADINPEPLKRGRQTVSRAGLGDKIETRLSDGLSEISGDEADDIVIAGMGGELIAEIIGGWSFSKDSSKRFILQPMTKCEALIDWLCRNGFEIIRQDCCFASGKCYTVLLVQYTGKTAERDELYRYLGELNPKANEAHRAYVKNCISRLDKQALGDRRFAALADKLREVCEVD